MLNVNECSFAAEFLSLSDYRERDCRLARAFRTVDLHDSSSRDSAYAQRHIKCHRACGNAVNVERFCLTQTHDSACAVLFFYLFQRGVKSRLFILFCRSSDNCGFFSKFFFSHSFPPMILSAHSAVLVPRRVIRPADSPCCS